MHETPTNATELCRTVLTPDHDHFMVDLVLVQIPFALDGQDATQPGDMLLSEASDEAGKGRFASDSES